MITKDGRDTPLVKLTPELYIVPKGEERFYHVLIEMRSFDPKTGTRLSRPRVQKFGKKIFDAHVRESLTKQGYTLVILHDPTEWLAKSREEAAAKAKADAEAKAKAEKEQFDAAVAAEVEKQVGAAVEAAVAKALAAAKKETKSKKDEGKETEAEKGEGKE